MFCMNVIIFMILLCRYGDIFKTHILGCPCVMLASPEAARFVLVTHDHLFKPTYPKSKEKMIGPWALFFHQGNYHTHLRKLVQSSLSPEPIRKLIPDIEAIAISALESCANSQVANTFHEMKKVRFAWQYHLEYSSLAPPSQLNSTLFWESFCLIHIIRPSCVVLLSFSWIITGVSWFFVLLMGSQ